MLSHPRPPTSHLLTTILVETIDAAGFVARLGKISLLDLAGSEPAPQDLGPRAATTRQEYEDTQRSLQAVGKAALGGNYSL